MSDTPAGFDPEDYTMDPATGALQEKQVPVSSKWRRDLERRAKKGDEAQAALADLQRQLALARAGIPDDPRGQMFAKAYDGPTDDPEAIKAAWSVVFPDAAQQAQVAQSLAGHENAVQMGAGAATAPPVDLMALMRAAKSPAELARILDENGIKPEHHPEFQSLRQK